MTTINYSAKKKIYTVLRQGTKLVMLLVVAGLISVNAVSSVGRGLTHDKELCLTVTEEMRT